MVTVTLLHELAVDRCVVSAIRGSQLFLLQVAHQHDGPLFIHSHFIFFSPVLLTETHSSKLPDEVDASERHITAGNWYVHSAKALCFVPVEAWAKHTSSCAKATADLDLLTDSQQKQQHRDSSSRTSTETSQVIGFHLRPTIGIVFQYHY